MTQVKTATSQFLDLIVADDNVSLNGSAAGLNNLPDSWANKENIAAPTRIVMVTIINSNPQRFRAVKKTIYLKTPPANIDPAEYDALLKNRSLWSSASENISKFNGSKCRLDMDLTDNDSDCMLILSCRHTRKLTKARFIPNSLPHKGGYPLMEKALFGYKNQTPIIWRPKMFRQESNYESIITFCHCTKNSEHEFAIGLRIEDNHTKKTTYTTDIIIDPKIKNDII